MWIYRHYIITFLLCLGAAVYSQESRPAVGVGSQQSGTAAGVVSRETGSETDTDSQKNSSETGVDSPESDPEADIESQENKAENNEDTDTKESNSQTSLNVNFVPFSFYSYNTEQFDETDLLIAKLNKPNARYVKKKRGGKFNKNTPPTSQNTRRKTQKRQQLFGHKKSQNGFNRQSQRERYNNIYLKTNAAGWAFAVSNVAVEFDFNKHLSLNIPVYYSAWNYFTNTVKFRSMGTQPELRYWILGDNNGWFIGAHFGVVYYNLALGGKYRMQDHNGTTPALGGGLSSGFRMHLSQDRRWNMELTLGFGGYRMHYDLFHNYHNGLLSHSEKRVYVGVDQAAVTFSYAFRVKTKTKTHSKSHNNKSNNKAYLKSYNKRLKGGRR